MDDDYVLIAKVGGLPTMASSKDYLDAISSAVSDLKDDLRSISLSIHDNPELQFKEFHAHEVLTAYLERQEGWEVKLSACGLETAFVGVYDTGSQGPVVSFNAEYGTFEQRGLLLRVRLMMDARSLSISIDG